MQTSNAPLSILVTPSGIVITFSASVSHLINTPFSIFRLENTYSPILVTLFGIVIGGKLEQFANARVPILVTLSGISMLVKLLHPSNAFSPMLFNPYESFTLVNLWHNANALFPMLRTLLGISIVVKPLH